MNIAVVIPALNEEGPLPLVLQDLAPLLASGFLQRVILVDNGSTDNTAQVAREGGAEVVPQPQRGYGSACLAGFANLANDPPDVVVILDADHSDYVEDLALLVEPIERGQADMVLGERTTLAERGALLPNQVFGNKLATALIQVHTGHRYRDMGPFRAIRWTSLMAMEMEDPAFGWNVEMQMKAIQRGLVVREVAVRYRTRVGTSKISGTIKGTVKAGIGILRATWRYRA